LNCGLNFSGAWHGQKKGTPATGKHRAETGKTGAGVGECNFFKSTFIFNKGGARAANQQTGARAVVNNQCWAVLRVARPVASRVSQKTRLTARY
jgi:hypothetical protein